MLDIGHVEERFGTVMDEARSERGFAVVESFLGSLALSDRTMDPDAFAAHLAGCLVAVVGGTTLVVLERDGHQRLAACRPDGELARAFDSPGRVAALVALALGSGPSADEVGDASAASVAAEREVLAVLADAGVRRVDGLELAAGGLHLGAAIWLLDGDELPPADRRVAAVLVRVAAVVRATAVTSEIDRLRADQLQHALSSRIVVEQAKGMLAEQSGASPDDAFAVLRAHSRRTSQRVHAVATEVIERRIGWGALRIR